MLVLSRKRDEKVLIGGGLVTVTVVEIRGDKVRLGFDGPREMPIHREEVQRQVDAKASLEAAQEASSEADKPAA